MNGLKHISQQARCRFILQRMKGIPGVTVKRVSRIHRHTGISMSRIETDPPRDLAPGIAGQITGSVIVHAPGNITSVGVIRAAPKFDPADILRPSKSFQMVAVNGYTGIDMALIEIDPPGRFRPGVLVGVADVAGSMGSSPDNAEYDTCKQYKNSQFDKNFEDDKFLLCKSLNV